MTRTASRRRSPMRTTPARRDGTPVFGPLLAGTALVALAMSSTAARGQTVIGNGIAFQGSATSALGTVTLASTGSGTTAIDRLTVNSTTAIVDWTPYDTAAGTAPISFLPGGATGVFQNGAGIANFTILNRINPSSGRPVEFDGHVVSQLVDASGAATRGGNVWFQAPGGVIIGASGVFDVGSLILTTNAINTNGDTTLPTAAGGLSFAGTAGSTSLVDVRAGAQINAPIAGSYLAIVAPRINQAGTATVNGSVGYIAAQAADVTINAGLFNIATAIGSTVAAGGETILTHSGTTTGPAETSSAAPHVIYMIAIPQNDAVTMLVSGNVGYQAATSATQVNGSIVLGGGVGFPDNPEGYGNGDSYPALGSSAPANIAIPGGSFTSAVNAQATGALTVDTSAGNLGFAGFLGQANGAATLHATAGHGITSSDQLDIESLGAVSSGASLTMVVDSGATLDVATLLQGARLRANGQSLTFDVNGTVTAGAIDITASRIRTAGDAIGGATTIDVAGSLTADSVYIGAIGQTDQGNATGGAATLSVSGIATIGDLSLAAGNQPLMGAATQTGGDAQGGTALVEATGAGQLTIGGTALLDTSSNAPSAATTSGGTAFFQATGGGTITANAVTMTAAASGGDAAGGVLTLQATAGGSLSASGPVQLLASGSNGDGAGVAAGGGAIGITASGGTVSLAGTTLLDARGLATSVNDAAAPAGYDATGGSLAIVTRSDASGRTGVATFGGAVTLDASALAYQGGDVATGSASGGFAGLNAQAGGAIAVQAGLLIDASANANSVGTDAGIISTGGTASVQSQGGAVTLAGTSAVDGLEIAADAQGGTATGGTALLTADAGTIDASSTVLVHASGFGGSLSTGTLAGFDGTGGTSAVRAASGAITLTGLRLTPSGFGGAGSGGLEGGNGLGGTAEIATATANGSITISNYANLSPFGEGGAGGTGSANGTGGSSRIAATGGRIAFTGDGSNPGDDEAFSGDTLYAIADGIGGSAQTTGRDLASGGIGRGGTVSLTADDGGTVSIASSGYLSPYGTGGTGITGSGGGTGIGGTVTLAALNSTGRAGTITFGSMLIDNAGFGGIVDGAGAGGAAIGGTSGVTVAQDAAIRGAVLTVQNTVRGGNASGFDPVTDQIIDIPSAGGAASGGSAIVTVAGGTLDITGDTEGNGTQIVNNVRGGNGFAGGTGGAATGGAASLALSSGTISGPAWGVASSALGGIGGAGLSGAGGAGGSATGGSATLAVSGGTLSTSQLAVTTGTTGGSGGGGAGFTDDPANPTPVLNGGAGGAGGLASGGSAMLAASGGSASSGTLAIAASVTGGAGGAGGDGAGMDGGTAATGGVGGSAGGGSGGTATLAVTGGTTAAATTTIGTAIESGGGGAGGLGGTDASGNRTAAAAGADADTTGGIATLSTDGSGSVALGDLAMNSGGTTGAVRHSGSIVIAAADGTGTAPAVPITLTSLTATLDGNTTTSDDRIQVTAAAPIAISGDATFDGFSLARFDMSGRGSLAVGGALSVDALEVIGTQTNPTAGTIAITAGSAGINARFAGLTLATLATTSGGIDLTSAADIALGNVTSAAGLTADAIGSMGFGTLTTAGDDELTVGGALGGASYTNTVGTIDGTVAGSTAITSVSAGDGVDIGSGGSARYGTVTAGTNPGAATDDDPRDFGSVGITALSGDLTIDTGITAAGSIGLVAANAISAPLLDAGATGSVGVLAGGPVTLGTVIAPDLFYVGGLSAIGDLDFDASTAEIVAQLRSVGPVRSGGAIAIGPVTAGTASISAGGTLSLATLDAAGDVALDAGGAITATDLASGGSLTANTGAALTIGTATAATDVGLEAQGSITADTVTAGRDAVASVYISSDNLIDQPRAVRIGTITAGDDAIVGAFDTATVGTIVTTGAGADGTSTDRFFGDVAGSSVEVFGGEGISVGAIRTPGSLTAVNFAQTAQGFIFDGTGGVSIDALTAGGAVGATSTNDFVTLGGVSAGAVTASGTTVSITAPGALTLATVNATTGAASVTAGGDVTGTSIASTLGSVGLNAGGLIDLASVSAGDSAMVQAGTSLHIGTLAVGTDTTSAANDGTGTFGSAVLIAGDTITLDDPLTVTGSVALVSRRAGITLDSLAAGAGGSVAVLAAGDIALGTVAAPDLLYLGGPAALNGLGDTPTVAAIIGALRTGSVASGGAISIGQATAGTATISAATTLALTGPLTTNTGPVILEAGGDLSGGDVASAGTLTATSDLGAVRLGSVEATTASITATGDVTTAAITGASGVTVTSSGGAVTLGDVATSGPGAGIALTATNALATGTLSSDGDIRFTAGGAVTGGGYASTSGSVIGSGGGTVDLAGISAGDGIVVTAGAALHLGAATAGTFAASTANDGTGSFGSIALRAGDTITVDRPLAAPGSIALVSQTAGISLASLSAGGSGGGIALLAGGPIALGTVTAPGLVYIGGPTAIGTLSTMATAPQILTALGNRGTVASGGAIALGTVTAGTATIAAGTTLTLGDTFTTTAGNAALQAGGDIAAHDLVVAGALTASSMGGAATFGRVTAGSPTTVGGIQLASMTNLTAGPLGATGSISATSSAGGLVLQDIESIGGGVSAMAGGGDIAMGNVRAAGSISVLGTGAITAGDLTAGTGPLLAGSGTVGGGGTDAATGGIATGFDGAAIQRCDDCFTDEIALPFTLNYFGQTYMATYVSNNGYLTFGRGQGSYTPGGLGTGYGGLPIIAAFFADVDTNNTVSARAVYGVGTFAGRQAFGATWNGVGYFPSAADKLDNFQIILTNRADTGAGNFDIYYNYTNIAWETGSASGGQNGFGGTSAAVGYNAGTGNQTGTYFELPGSRVPGSFINSGTAPLVTTTNDGIAGQLLFSVRNGQVTAGGAATEPPTIHVSNSASPTGGDIRLGDLSAEAAEVHGAARVTVGNVSVGDRASGITAVGQPYATVLDATGGLIAGTVTSTGLIALGSRSGDVSAGAVAGGASVVALADGSVTLASVTTGTGANDTLFVGGAATDALPGFSFATLLSGTDFDPATLATVTPVPAGGGISIAGPVSTGNLRAVATGAIDFADVSASGAILIDGGSGVTAASLTGGGAIAIAGAGDLALGPVASSGGTVDLTSSGGGIATAGIAGAGDVTVRGETDLALGPITSGGGQVIASANTGGIVAGAIGAAGGVTVNGVTDVALGTVSAGGAVSATSSMGNLSAGTTQAGTQVSYTAAGLLAVAGIAGTDIALSSGDIVIADGAAIDAGRIAFVNTGTGVTAIGDNTGTAGGYALSGAELATAHATAITVGPAARESADGVADTVIGDLTLRGATGLGQGASANLLGDTGRFTVSTPGAIRVAGASRFTNLAAGNTVSLFAGGDLTGVLPAGSVALDNGAGALAGTLALQGGTILFATPDAAATVRAATDAATIDTALADPGTLANPAGYLRADTVRLTFANALYTQNSGATTALADRAGVTAGAGGIKLVPLTEQAATPARLVLNARFEQGGTTVAGAQAFRLLALAPTGFNAGATLNGCLLAGSNCGVAVPIATEITQTIQPVQDVVGQVTLASGLGNAASYSFETPTLISTVNLTPPTLTPLIDEPVTGAGNDDLWIGVGVGRDLAPMGGEKKDVKP